MNLEVITLSLGLSTTLFSFYSSGKFTRCQAPLSSAIGWTLIGEGVMGAVTTAFALLALSGLLDSVPEDVQNGMRIVMFSVASLTTGGLIKELHKIEGK